MTIRDVASGLALLGLGALLFSQTFVEGSEIVFEDDVDPMQYPRLLTILLMGLGLFIAGKGLAGKGTGDKGDFPVFTRRTLGVMLVLLAYGLSFTSLGFFISSAVAFFVLAVIMGWRRLPTLALVCLATMTFIWFLYTWILRIPLPSGSIF